MDESQAGASTRAIREPGRVAREHVQRRRVAAARSLAMRRVVAGLAPPGIAPRAVLAQAAGHRLIVGML